MQRLAKAIGNSRICSRREAEVLILSNKVKVNGIPVLSPIFKVTSSDKIEVNGQIINCYLKPRLWIYYKPRGLINSFRDDYNRKTIFQDLSSKINNTNIISIGRLDFNSEGLLLLTNNTILSRKLELPKNKIERIYHVRVYGKLNDKKISFLTSLKNLNIDNIIYKPKSIKMISTSKNNSWFKIVLTEGKNQEIKKIFHSLDLLVSRLIRVAYGPFNLQGFLPGDCKEQLYSSILNILND